MGVYVHKDTWGYLLSAFSKNYYSKKYPPGTGEAIYEAVSEIRSILEKKAQVDVVIREKFFSMGLEGIKSWAKKAGIPLPKSTSIVDIVESIIEICHPFNSEVNEFYSRASIRVLGWRDSV